MNVAVHFALTYLTLTETWIYNQIRNLTRYTPIVYALQTQNLHSYPTKQLRALIRTMTWRNGSHTLTPSVFQKIRMGAQLIYPYLTLHPYFILSLIRDHPDIVHAHYGPSGYSFLKLTKLFNLPLITSFYGYDMSMLPHQHRKWKERYRKLFAQGDRFLVEGSHMKKCLLQLGCPEEKIAVQHLGVDLDQIKFIPRELTGQGEIRVLMAGSFKEKKGIPFGVEAFGRVRKKHNNVSLTIVGDSSGTLREENEKMKILKTIEKHRLNPYVKLMGYQPYPVFLDIARKHHIFMAPSIHASDGDIEGGAPVSIIEMSASGMPILSTTHCDIPEVVVNGNSGLLVPERDVTALTEQLEFLVSNPVIWKKMGAIGRKHIEHNYNVTTQVKKLENIYDSLQ